MDPYSSAQPVTRNLNKPPLTSAVIQAMIDLSASRPSLGPISLTSHQTPEGEVILMQPRPEKGAVKNSVITIHFDPKTLEKKVQHMIDSVPKDSDKFAAWTEEFLMLKRQAWLQIFFEDNNAAGELRDLEVASTVDREEE